MLPFPSHHAGRLLSLGALVVAAGSACATPRAESSAAASTAAPVANSAPAGPGVTDADIAAIVVAANTIDVRNGELALARSSNAEVKKFAQRMITDHNAVNQSAVTLVTKLGVTPTENATSTGLTASADTTRTRLGSLSGAAFDKAYLDNEVAYHQTVLNALDTVLLPNAQNAELKATLVSVRPAFVAHLQHAQQLQASLPAGQ
jgi:putative membrane protein